MPLSLEQGQRQIHSPLVEDGAGQDPVAAEEAVAFRIVLGVQQEHRPDQGFVRQTALFCLLP